MNMQDEISGAMAEIGNLCVAGGANEISKYSEELVDISVVSFEIKDKTDLLLEINIYDDCKIFFGLEITGDIEDSYILFRLSDFEKEDLINLFPKLRAESDDIIMQIKTLLESYSEGFCEGMNSMTGIELEVVKPSVLVEDFDIDNLGDKVACFNSIITVGLQEADFDVYFFSNADIIVPKMVEALEL